MISILIKITLCVTLAIVLTATTSNIEIIYGYVYSINFRDVSYGLDQSKKT